MTKSYKIKKTETNVHESCYRKIDDELLSRLGERGYRCSIVSVQHLDDLKREIESLRNQGLIDQRLYHEYFTSFSYHPPESLAGARSLIVVATPQPQIQVIFQLEGKISPPHHSSHLPALFRRDGKRPSGRRFRTKGLSGCFFIASCKTAIRTQWTLLLREK